MFLGQFAERPLREPVPHLAHQPEGCLEDSLVNGGPRRSSMGPNRAPFASGTPGIFRRLRSRFTYHSRTGPQPALRERHTRQPSLGSDLPHVPLANRPARRHSARRTPGSLRRPRSSPTYLSRDSRAAHVDDRRVRHTPSALGLPLFTRGDRPTDRPTDQPTDRVRAGFDSVQRCFTEDVPTAAPPALILRRTLGIPAAARTCLT